MVNMNFFRILADISHTVSIGILIWAIHTNKSAEGVSLITQVFYAAVFVTRYGDLFWTRPWLSWWNTVLKILYLTTSFYIIFIMTKVYARTREREKAWRLGAYCLSAALLTAPLASAIARGKNISLFDIMWTFSIVLESVCVIPQLLLLRQTTVPTVIDSGYILTLGSYRALYILNWILRYANKREPNPDTRAVIFGILQTAFYVDFAWVYWTRQRVKLRNGGVVDADDLSRGFLVGKLFGRGPTGITDEETAPLGQESVNRTERSDEAPAQRWGARGISVSADDDVILPPSKRSPGQSVDTVFREDEVVANGPNEEARLEEASEGPEEHSVDHVSSSARVWS